MYVIIGSYLGQYWEIIECARTQDDAQARARWHRWRLGSDWRITFRARRADDDLSVIKPLLTR